jgi:hypothetical protein
MNAVERLLAHGERALRFFGDVLRERHDGPLSDEAVPFAVAAELFEYCGGWQSRHLLGLAVLRNLDRKQASALRAAAKQEYARLLDERAGLLDVEQLRSMLSEVVRDAPAWGDFARGDVVTRAEAVVDALDRLRALLPCPISGRDSRRNNRYRHWQRLRRALLRLHAFKHPPQASKRAGQGKTGRPRVVDEKKQRELVAGWRDFERRYDGDGKPTKAQYIAERCRGQRKGSVEQATLEARERRALQTALDNERRKKRELRDSRTK